MEESDKLKPLPGAVPRRRVWVLAAWLVILMWQFPLVTYLMRQLRHTVQRAWNPYRPVPVNPVHVKPPPAKEVPRWRDEFWISRTSPAAPRLQALSYREGLMAGLTWMYGAQVLALDFEDARLGKHWVVTPPAGGATLRAELTVTIDEAGRAEMRATGPKGSAVLRTMEPYAKANPLGSGADQALDDLPKMLALLGGEAWPKRSALPPGQVGPWSPGNLATLAEALEPLREAPATVSPAALARVARALAWTALLDHRLAPLIAVQRAAQSLAFASVAERVAAVKPPEAAAARWLAVGAAVGDFWILTTGQAPPAGNPDLDVLYHALDSAEPLVDLPEAQLLPAVVASCARGEAISDHGVTAKLIGRFAVKPESSTISSYLASYREFSTVASTYAVIAQFSLVEMLSVPAFKSAAGVGYEQLSEVQGTPKQNTTNTLAMSRRCIKASLTAPCFADRVLLREGGERFLRTLEVNVAAFSQYGWEAQIKETGEALRAYRTWQHPQVQWMLSEQALSGLPAQPAKNPAVQVALNALVFAPGLAIVSDSRIGTEWRLEASYTAFSSFIDHPVMTYRTIRELARSERWSDVAGLLEAFHRDGKKHPPIVWMGFLRFRPGSLIPALAETADPALTPGSAMRAARTLQETGRGREAQELLQRAQLRTPENLPLYQALCRICVDRSDVKAARAALDRYLASKPGGLLWCRAELDLAAALMEDAPQFNEMAVELSRAARESGAAWAHLDHALNCAVAGLGDEAIRELDACDEHYGASPAHALVRAQVTVLASRGTRGWEALEGMLAKASLSDASLVRFATDVQRMGLKLPATKLARRLDAAALIRPLDRKQRAGTVKLEDLETLVRACDAAGASLDDIGSVCGRITSAFAATTLLNQAVTGAPIAIPPVYVRHTARFQGIGIINVSSFMNTMLELNATDDQLSKVATALAGQLPPEDRVTLECVLRDPGGLRRWMCLAVQGDSLLDLNNYLAYLWISGRDAALRDLCNGLFGLLARRIGWALNLATGSVDATKELLIRRGVNPMALGAWGVDRAVPAHRRAMLAHFRPDGSNRNPLAE